MKINLSVFFDRFALRNNVEEPFIRRKTFLNMFLIGLCLLCFGNGIFISNCGFIQEVFAADTQIILDANAQKFSKVESDIDFLEMEPGEERTGNIQIQNTCKQPVTFYLSQEIIENIAARPNTTGNGVFTIALYRDDEKEPFFEKKIGKQELSTEEVQLKTLKYNEWINVHIQIKLDGASFDNSYQQQMGTLRFHIRAEKNEKTDTPVVTVLTGDSAHIFFWSCLFVFAIAGIYWGLRTLFKR